MTGQIDQVVLLLGSADVAAAKQFYVERGLTVAKSFPRVYVEFDMPPSAIKLASTGIGRWPSTRAPRPRQVHRIGSASRATPGPSATRTASRGTLRPH